MYTGRAAGFWFLFAMLAVETAVLVVGMKDTVPPVKQAKASMEDTEERGSESYGTEAKT